jgi:hypothetical protein
MTHEVISQHLEPHSGQLLLDHDLTLALPNMEYLLLHTDSDKATVTTRCFCVETFLSDVSYGDTSFCIAMFPSLITCSVSSVSYFIVLKFVLQHFLRETVHFLNYYKSSLYTDSISTNVIMQGPLGEAFSRSLMQAFRC